MNLKQLAGEKATEYIKDGMVVGLGTGSTAYYAIKKIGALVEEGWKLIGVPTSVQSEKLAKECGIPLSNLQEHPEDRELSVRSLAEKLNVGRTTAHTVLGEFQSNGHQ